MAKKSTVPLARIGDDAVAFDMEKITPPPEPFAETLQIADINLAINEQ